MTRKHPNLLSELLDADVHGRRPLGHDLLQLRHLLLVFLTDRSVWNLPKTVTSSQVKKETAGNRGEKKSAINEGWGSSKARNAPLPGVFLSENLGKIQLGAGHTDRCGWRETIQQSCSTVYVNVSLRSVFTRVHPTFSISWICSKTTLNEPLPPPRRHPFKYPNNFILEYEREKETYFVHGEHVCMHISSTWRWNEPSTCTVLRVSSYDFHQPYVPMLSWKSTHKCWIWEAMYVLLHGVNPSSHKKKTKQTKTFAVFTEEIRDYKPPNQESTKSPWISLVPP